MTFSPSTTRDIKRINRSNVMRSLFFTDSISRFELSKISALSPATVTNITAELLDEEIIIESGIEDSQGGRPRTTIAFNSRYGSIIGIDLGETHIYCELFDLKLRSLHHVRYDTSPEENHAKTIAALITQGINELLGQANVSRRQLIGIGIGVPGTVNPVNGVSITAPNWGWHDVPLLDMLKQDIDVDIWLNNGAQAMALAEMWFGAGVGLSNLAVLLVGTGVGSGIITNGKLYRGASNSAGEWGHFCIEMDGRSCRCGSSGCLEAYVGAPAVIHRFNQLDDTQLLASQESQTRQIALILKAAEEENHAAIQVLHEVTHYLGVGIANIINFVNPQLITLGGWQGRIIGKYILDDLRQTAERYSLPQPWKAVNIEISQIGWDAVSLGAASIVLEKFLDGEIHVDVAAHT